MTEFNNGTIPMEGFETPAEPVAASKDPKKTRNRRNKNNANPTPEPQQNQKEYEDNAARMAAIRTKRMQKQMNERQFAMIPAYKLRCDSKVVKRKSDNALLGETLGNHGMLQPLSVCGPLPDGTYNIIDGFRRFQTIKNMLADTPDSGDVLFPCYIVENGKFTSDEQDLMRMACNITQRASSKALVFAYVQVFQQRAANGTDDENSVVKRVADSCGFGVRYAQHFRNVWLHGTQKIIDAVSADELPIKIANDIVCAFRNNKARQDEEAELYMAASNNSEKSAAKERLNGIIAAQKDGVTGEEAVKKHARGTRLQKLSDKTISSLTRLMDENPEAGEVSEELLQLCFKILDKYSK